MKQQLEKEENIAGKALYDLIAIFNEINLDMKKRAKKDEIYTIV